MSLSGKIGDPDRFYIRDALDESAFTYYVSRHPLGMRPPVRPNEWAGADEESVWNSLRSKVSSE